MHINNIFATPIYDSTIDNKICSEYTEQILNLIKDSNNISKKARWSVATKDNINKLKSFEPLCNIINEHVTAYCEEGIGVRKELLHLSCMWSNVQLNGCYHPVHDHPNSFISGVLYLQVPEDCEDGEKGEIFFVDPRVQKRMYNPEYFKRTEMSERGIWIKPKSGTIILFPSWLEHGTEYFFSKEEKNRISLSFNYIITECSIPTISFKL